MRLVSATKEKFTPEFLNNLELPEKEQLAIHLTFPTIEEKEGVSEIEYIRGKGGEVHGFKIIYNTEYLLKNHVPKIDNLIDEVDGKDRPIKNGAELLQSKNKSIQGLVQLIVNRLTSADEIGGDEVKNSEPPVS